jgi:glycosyltransferase involved in cell wall biosynthesis
MRVTILTPTLNAERFLPECLSSIRGQTYPREKIQHLVLDGESADATARLAREAGAEVDVARDGSLYEAMNRGMALARGEIVGWLNADDVLRAGAIDAVVRAFRASADAEIVVGDCEIASADGVQVIRARRDALERVRLGRRRGGWVNPLATFFRTSTLRSLGEYAAWYRIAADLDLWLRAAARQPLPRIVHAGAVIGTFRVHPGSLSSGARRIESARELARIGRSWWEDASAPAGVRRYALFVHRRYTYLQRMWEVAGRGPAARLGTALACYRELRALGPGTVRDMRTGVTEA